jgi:hypothetical protein
MVLDLCGRGPVSWPTEMTDGITALRSPPERVVDPNWLREREA